MKLKNVVVGSNIEAKHDTKFFTKGNLVKVMAKEDDDYFGEMTLNVMDSDGDTLWVNHKDFRRPRPKKLDQSIFDGVDSRYSYFAIDEDGMGGFYEQKPELCGDYFTSGHGWHQVGQYDASNWQNSLIERDIAKELAEVDLSSELTGSELCKAMLARGDKYVMCKTNDNDFIVISGTYEADDDNDAAFVSTSGEYTNVMPINNQGEPLTAKDVGL